MAFKPIIQPKQRQSLHLSSPSMPASVPPVQENFPRLPATLLRPTDVASEDADADAGLVATAIHVISTERAALSNLERIYQTDQLARENLTRAVTQIASSVKNGGKLVVCGVGKSGKIGRKVEATMNSMGIHSAFLHPTEALHGDLGMVRPDDTLLLISFSGRTPELLLLLPHIPPTVSVIAITSHSHPSTCPLLSYHPPELGILLPAPIHEDEESSFGVCAPTSSTTVALSLGDALAIAVARKLHTLPGRGPAEVFKGFHPGGAIGAASALSTPNSMSASMSSISTISSPSSGSSTPPSDYLQSRPVPPRPLVAVPQPQLTLLPPASHSVPDHHGKLLRDSATFVPLQHIPTVSSPSPDPLRLLDILLTALQHPNAKSWVFLSESDIIPPRRIRSLSQRTRDADDAAHIGTHTHVADLADRISSFSVNKRDWLCVPASSTVDDVWSLLRSDSDSESESESSITVVAVMADGYHARDKGKFKDELALSYETCLGVIEADDVRDSSCG